MAGVAESVVECEEAFEAIGDVERSKNVVREYIFGAAVNELDAGVVAEDVDLGGGGVGGEAAGEGGEVDEGFREREFEERD